MKIPLTKKKIDTGLSAAQQLGKSKADRKARKKAKAEALERAKQKAKEEDCTTRMNFVVGDIDKPTVDMSDKNDNVQFECNWIKDKQMDVGDILDEVDCPEDCSTFVSMSFGVAKEWDTGLEEHDNEIDKSVQVLRRICKLLLVEQVFAKLPNYHSWSVMYDPDQSPRQVRMSIYLTGNEQEVRNAYGIPLPLNEMFTSFSMRGVMRPSSSVLFHPTKGENIVMNEEFQMRANVSLSFKRRTLSDMLQKMINAMKEFYPYVGQYHPEEVARDIGSTKSIEEILLGVEEEEKTEEDEENEDKMKQTAAEKNDASLLPTVEKNEQHGGTSVMPWIRNILEIIRANIPYDTKQEIELAVPSLSVLLLPDLPDCFNPYLSLQKRIFLANLIHSPGGMMDTVKQIWNSIIGYEWSWDNFNAAMFQVYALLSHSETNKMEELIHASHHTFRNVLTNISSIRIQCGDRGLLTELTRFDIRGFVPPGPSKSMIAERERKKKEAQMRAAKT